MKLCEYGCGQEAKYQLKNGKWCCSKSSNSCPTNINSKKYKRFDNQENHLCDYGCGQLAKFISKKGKYCCNDHLTKCSIMKNKYGLISKGKIRGPHSEERKHNISKAKKGKPVHNIEFKESQRNKMLNGFSKTLNEIPRDPNKLKIKEEKQKERMLNGMAKYVSLFRKPHTDDRKENQKKFMIEKGAKIANSAQCQGFKNKKEWMLNGGASYLNSCPVKGFKNHKEWLLNGGHSYISSFIKKISKDEIKLRNLVQELYLNCIPQYKILNYEIDIALPEYKIAVEFDGYYHFDTEEHKEYHKQRQIKIENEGWKFYRVTMFDKFPSLEEVKESIQKLSEEN